MQPTVNSRGLTKRLVRQLSDYKNEPDWMLSFRLKALEIFFQKKLPVWGADLSKINFENIDYFQKPTTEQKSNWMSLPAPIRKTYQALGIPEAEQKYLAGVTAQYDSGVVYGSLLTELQQKGVVFVSMETGLKEYPRLVQKYLGKLIPPEDNKFAALNSAAWSGGSFVYVPQGVTVSLPLQAYFRINARRIGQFERTLIIAGDKCNIHFIEGCTSPVYSEASLHAGVVEIFVGKSARVRYTTVQNWSNNIYNLVTKRAVVEAGGLMEWVDGNMGSFVTMKYPSTVLKGKKAKAEILSLSIANNNQHQDTGGKMIHLAPQTSSRIISKSIAMGDGLTNFRGLVEIKKGATGSQTKVTCNSLLLSKKSRAGSYPAMNIAEKNVVAEHEATVSKLAEEELFYLRSRGIDKSSAESLMVKGFIEPIVKELPFEYAMELNVLIKHELKVSQQ